mmetsp:Transcript_8631/g.20189  ORF Transcript_8631/g.20189 Transcript_8631/m.20189 type:complete len:211 (+) Transcript_8631:254-886(+)
MRARQLHAGALLSGALRRQRGLVGGRARAAQAHQRAGHELAEAVEEAARAGAGQDLRRAVVMGGLQRQVGRDRGGGGGVLAQPKPARHCELTHDDLRHPALLRQLPHSLVHRSDPARDVAAVRQSRGVRGRVVRQAHAVEDDRGLDPHGRHRHGQAPLEGRQGIDAGAHEQRDSGVEEQRCAGREAARGQRRGARRQKAAEDPASVHGAA